jgi:hypothetical protein
MVFPFDFLLLKDVNEWIINERAECVLPHINIRNWFTRSHPSKEDNRTGKPALRKSETGRQVKERRRTTEAIQYKYTLYIFYLV